MNKGIPEHERLFDEICGKLNELSLRSEGRAEMRAEMKPEIRSEISPLGASAEVRPVTPAKAPERFEKIQSQLRKTQDDWKAAQEQIHERMKSFESFHLFQGEMSNELRRISELLEQERSNNARLSSDLAKALELNLKLQFDIEEAKARGQQAVNEERKHNSFLVEKNKSLSNELELSQALHQDLRQELSKARDKFQSDQMQWQSERHQDTQALRELKEKAESLELRIDELEAHERSQMESLQTKEEELVAAKLEIESLTETIEGFETHAQQQNELIKKLTSAAEQKMVELKLALDKKSLESNDYYSHLQQALTQVQVLKQENGALKEYISKIAVLHQQQQQQK